MIEGVVLLGWGAAKRRHLQPYEAWYRERGLAVVSEVLDPAAARRGRPMSAEIHRIAQQVYGLDGPLLVHMFSRVGFITYAALLESPLGVMLRAHVGAHVFDSGPGVPLRLTARVYARQMSGGISAALTNRPRLRRLAQPALSTALWAHYHLAPRVRRHYADARSRFSEHAPIVPALCLCSPTDAVVDISDIEVFAARERRRGATVEQCMFPRSAHVQHFRLHPKRYGDALDRFMTHLARGGASSRLDLCESG